MCVSFVAFIKVIRIFSTILFPSLLAISVILIRDYSIFSAAALGSDCMAALILDYDSAFVIIYYKLVVKYYNFTSYTPM